jgi:hypothetical protein
MDESPHDKPLSTKEIALPCQHPNQMFKNKNVLTLKYDYLLALFQKKKPRKCGAFLFFQLR